MNVITLIVINCIIPDMNGRGCVYPLHRPGFVKEPGNNNTSTPLDVAIRVLNLTFATIWIDFTDFEANYERSRSYDEDKIIESKA